MFRNKSFSGTKIAQPVHCVVGRDARHAGAAGAHRGVPLRAGRGSRGWPPVPPPITKSSVSHSLFALKFPSEALPRWCRPKGRGRRWRAGRSGVGCWACQAAEAAPCAPGTEQRHNESWFKTQTRQHGRNPTSVGWPARIQRAAMAQRTPPSVIVPVAAADDARRSHGAPGAAPSPAEPGPAPAPAPRDRASASAAPTLHTHFIQQLGDLLHRLLVTSLQSALQRVIKWS